MKTKTCKGRCGRDLPDEDFELRKDTGKRRAKCGQCIWQERADREASAETRQKASDHEALTPDDYGAAIANVPGEGAVSSKASAEKRQEFNRKMAQVHSDVHDVANGTSPDLSVASVDYLATLSEAERRFGNRRIARSTAISLAHEMLGIRMFCQAADTYFTGKISPAGYAAGSAQRRPIPAPGELDRTVSIVLSDLHLGARLSELEHPTPFRRQEESRRLAHVVDQTLSYKPQYRKRTRLKVLLNGDVIQGMLLHDLRDGAPLTEQMVIFWDLMSQAIARFAADFPQVDVHCQPGNHGRDKLRHEGRATSSKWDGHEWRMYYALSKMAAGLPNVTFDIPFRAVSLIDYYGQTVAMTHGDTEVPLGAPSTQHDRNLGQLQKIAASRSLGCEPEAWVVGHFHSGCIMPGSPTVIYNGMLVPPDGHARTSGYVDKPCGQWLIESVRGHVVGDMRYVRVGLEQDRDAGLDQVLRPSAFPVMQ